MFCMRRVEDQDQGTLWGRGHGMFCMRRVGRVHGIQHLPKKYSVLFVKHHPFREGTGYTNPKLILYLVRVVTPLDGIDYGVKESLSFGSAAEELPPGFI